MSARLEKLSPEARAWLGNQLRERLGEGSVRLVGYAVPRPGRRVEAAELERFAREALPSHMVPAELVVLEQLPRLPNGKVDRRALPAPSRRRAAHSPASGSADATEAALVRLFAEVLGIERVAPDEGFFELGGDSILSIQLVARAAKLGLAIAPQALFEHPTPRALARTVSVARAPVERSSARASGLVPLTPIQHWFFEQELPDRHHFNQAMLLEPAVPLDETSLRSALRALVARHDVFRYQYLRSAAGWQQLCLPEAAEPLLVRLDLSSEADEAGALARAVAELQASLRLEEPPLLRAGWISLRGGERLLLVLHHLLTDAVSWQVLLDDLDAALSQARSGAPVALAPPTTSFKEWSEALSARALSGAFDGEAEHWRRLRAPRPLPVDFASGDRRGTVESARSLTFSLTADETERLVRELPARERATVQEILLTAVAAACAAWTGHGELGIDLEGHGREPIVEGVDLSGTVGWFTTLYPLALDWSGATEPSAMLRAVKEQLRAIVGRGIGYGVLRYLSGDAALRRALSDRPGADVYFNYLGQRDGLLRSARLLAPAPERLSGHNGPLGRRSHALEVNAAIEGGVLGIELTYSERVHRRGTIAALGDGMLGALRRLLSGAQAIAPAAPSDFPLARIDQSALDALLLAVGNDDVDEILPLSPVQQGMLFHALEDPSSDVYLVELRAALEGPLDREAFARAWDSVVARHPALRASFHHRQGGEPVSVVHRLVAVPLAIHDLSDRDEREQARFIEAQAHRREPMSIECAPLMRVDLFVLGPERCEMVWALHHLVADGWSGGNVLAELLALHDAFAEGHSADLPPVRPYRDFLAWLAGREDDAGFWAEELAGATGSKIELGAAGDDRREYGRATSDVPLGHALAACARRLGVTPATVATGAFALLMSRVVGAGDVTIGTVLSGRPASLDGAAAMVGMFMNSLPLRTRVDEDESVGAFLRAVGARQARLREHEHSALSEVQKRSPVAPLFEALFAFESFPAHPADHRLRCRILGGVERTSFPLSFTVEPLGETLRLGLQYDARRFGRAAVEELLASYRAILGAMIEQPDARLVDLPMVDDPARCELVGPAHDHARLAHESFLAQAAVAPERLALCDGKRELRYGELAARARRLARALAEAGVGPEVPVPIVAPRSAALVLGELAVLLAGGAFVPIDPSWPARRIAGVLEEIAAPIACASGASIGGALALDAYLDEGGDASFEPARVGPGELAYVVYTSGSTGRPKGVAIEHRGLSNLVGWSRRAFSLGPDDAMSLIASPGFDASIWEIWPTLASGGRLHVVPSETRLSPAALLSFWKRAGVTVAFVPTPLAEELARELGDRELGLRLLLTGGDTLHEGPWQSLPLVNCYGPTESSVVATAAFLQGMPIAGTPPIGAPVDNTRVIVVDTRMHPVPPGVAGELCIGGPSLARGYFGREELTRARFVPHPFREGERVYRTGDRARVAAGGMLEHLGRLDEQVKIRGNRVELGEIEALLARIEGVRAAAVVARDEGPTKRLHAFVAGHVDVRGALAELGAQLPDYMVPATLSCLDALPLTPSGKIDRRALVVPAVPSREREHRAPHSDLEKLLCRIWQEVLGLEREPGIDDDFFALGGDSILSIQIAGRASRAGIELRVRDLFEQRTIAAIARAGRPASTAEAPQGEAQLTPIQRWFFEQEFAEPHHFNMALRVAAKQALDPDLLERASAALVRHHRALGWRFERRGGGWQARPSADVDGCFVRRPRAPAAEVSAELQARFDLGRGPLFTVALLDGDGDQELLLVAHHLVVDSVSWAILLADLETAYLALSRGDDPDAALGKPTASYEAWSAHLARSPMQHDEDSKLEPPPPLPRRDRGENTRGSSEELWMALDEATTERLLGGGRYRTDEVLLAALARAFSAWTEERKLVVDVEHHGRDGALDVSRTVGWFTTIQQVVLEAGSLEQVAVALRRVRRRAGGRDNPPQAEVLFNYLGRIDRRLAASELFVAIEGDLGPLASPRAHRAHLFEINALVRGGRLAVAWTFSRNLHERALVETLAERFGAEVRTLLGELDERIEAALPLSPMQHGMLFHALSNDGRDASDVAQSATRLEGPLDVARLEKAWQALVDRHAALRSAIQHEGLVEPQLLVHRSVALPIRTLRRSRADLDAHLEAERRAPFDLGEPPLLRISILSLGHEEHVLVWTYPLLLLDGWSAQALSEELVRLYRGEALPEPVPLAPHLEWLARQPLAAAESYWRQSLAGLAAPSALPLPTPADPRPGHRLVSLSLGAQASARLAAYAQSEGLTVNSVVQGAWAILLQRYTQQHEVLFGAVDSGRSAPVPGIDRVVGNLVRTLPVRARVRDEERPAHFLSALQTEQLSAREHGHARLVDIHGWSEVPRTTPLFESIVVFENYPADPVTELEPGVRIAELPHVEHTPYPLALFVLVGPELRLVLDYDAARFDAADVARLGEHLARILSALPESDAVGAIDILTDSERAALVDDSARSYPDLALPALFALQAAQSPDALALVFGDERLSYRTLAERVNRLAHHLRARGVGRGALVGVCLERSPELLVALLGVLASGAAYVPLDPALPAERIGYIASDADLALVITRRRLASRLDQSLELLCLDEEARAIAAASAEPLASEACPDDLAYVIYTSGSTGRPKGVAVEHRALGNFLFSMKERPGIESADRLLAVTTVSFDIAALELYLPLVVGAALVMATEEQAADGLALARALDEHGISLMQATPVTWRLLLEAGWSGRCSLRMLSGGEALPRDLAERLVGLGAELWNMYGPTETTIWSSVERVGRGAGPVLIGKPIANTELLVLDGAMRPLPFGVPGELWIGGRGLARGYLGRPELTEERFVPHPWRPGERLYRTGDRARRLPGGIECLGRVDQQIKLRGHRIELGEIEAVLGEHPAVSAAAVVLRGSAGDGRLVAYVASHPSAIARSDELDAHLARKLPAYMLPSQIVVLDALPLTPNRKIDRRALPDPAPRAHATYAAPRSAAERALARIWEQLLAVERVGTADRFVELGGHSLRAMQAVARVWSELGVRVSPSAMLSQPLAAIAAGIEQQRAGRERGQALAPFGRARPERLPLSFAQQRLWYLDQLDPGGATYNLPAAFRIAGTLDVERLRSALEAVVARHEPLRTSYVLDGDEPVQRVAPPEPIELPLVDCERERLDAVLAEEAARGFDLARGPILRPLLLRLAPDEHVLSIVVHHIAADGWSLGLLERELAAAYAGRALPAVEVGYPDYAAWQRRWLTEARLDEQLRYWKEQLAGDLPTLELPADRPRPRERSWRGGVVETALDPALVARLESVARARGATLFMVLLAAFDALIHRLTGSEDVVVGTPIGGRVRPELEGLVGLFTNTLVLRTDVSGKPRFSELVARVREVCLGAFAHEDLPFERLVEELRPERDMSVTPLFQALFSYQELSASRADEALRLERLSPRTTVARTDVSLWLSREGGTLRCTLEHSADLFERATAERLLERFAHVLAAAAADPDVLVSELPLSTEPDRLVESRFNDTAAPELLSDGATLHGLVAGPPDAPAVRFAEKSLSFRELAEQSNRFAHRLRALGVGRETLVGLCLERSERMLVSLLAILKAGGAYVPIDPSYPRERVAHMLRDSGLSVLVTEPSAAGVLDVEELTVVDLERDAAAIAAEPCRDLDEQSDPSSLAYVIYTSGSTGLPKGVQIEHRAAVNLVRSMMRAPGIAPSDRLLAVTTLSFDIALLELFAPLAAGATVVVCPSESASDGNALGELLRDEAITVMQATPSTWRLLCAAGWRGEVKALCGGEALPPELAVDLAGRCSELWNMYGPTETTVWSTCERVEVGRPVRLGRPIANTQVRVLDASLQPLPPGVWGEIAIGGAGVARGYLERPELTAQRFVRDPLDPHARLYRTGDLGRIGFDGRLEFSRRLDHQVKVRGHRIELGEIETVLAQHDAVAAAVVVVREPSAGDARLVAYHVRAPRRTATTTELRRHLRQRLPDYMIPQHFVELEAMPLTPNGKVDRKALPDGFGGPSQGPAFRQAESEHERLVARITRELLGVERVSMADNFFDLGGHSLLSMRLIARLEDETGIRLSPRVVLLNPLAQVAAELAMRVSILPPTATEAAAVLRAARQEVTTTETKSSPLVRRLFESIKRSLER